MLLIILFLVDGVVGEIGNVKSAIKYNYDYSNLYDDNYEKHLITTATVNPNFTKLDVRIKRFESPLRRTLGPKEIYEVKSALRDLFANRRMENPFTAIDITTKPDINNIDNNNASIYFDSNRDTADGAMNILTITRTKSPTKSVHPSRSWSRLLNLPPLEDPDDTQQDHVSNISRMPHQTEVTRITSYKDPFYKTILRQNPTTITGINTTDTQTPVADATVTETTLLLTTTEQTTMKPTTPEPKIDINALVNLIANLTYEYEMNLTQEFNETLQKYNIPTCPSLVTTTTTEQTTTEYFANSSIIAKIADFAICEHTLDKPNHYMRFDRPQILAKENRYIPRMVRKAIEIDKHPNFNREDGWRIPQVWDPIIRTIKSQTQQQTASRPQDTCFVCGLSEPGVPTNGNCGDAFATDFMPLVPIDPRARGQVTRYRKYCRYLDVPHFFYNETLPHSIFGRWTGGCAVRWTDLTNAYTQRTCRQRLHPTTGRHFGSKRMAKLELALKDVENGCLASPMASLLPLSRGVSLYARFHVCVCTGNWCNISIDNRQCIYYNFILSLFIVGFI